MNRDLTRGKPSAVLWRFCLPLFGSVLFQQLYTIADSLIAGRFIGENALAAVGNSYEITLIYLAFSFGCSVGCSILVSYFFGADDFARLKTTVSTAAIASGALCAGLMLLGFLGGGAMLSGIHTPPEILDDSRTYLMIYTAGIPFLMFYNIATGVFSALGDSRTPFLFLACSSAANIGMDVLFVVPLSMGVAGVAWATVICQGISCVLSAAVVLARLRDMRCKEKPALFSLPIFRRILAVAVPTTLQQGIISVGNIVIQSVINGFGPGVIAGYSAGVKLNNLVITSFTTVGNGMSNYTAQNIGAGERERVRAGFRAGVRLLWVLCVPLCLLYFFCGEGLIRFFMDAPTDTAVQTGVLFLRILSPFYGIACVKLIADGVLKGTQQMRLFMIATFTDLLLRVVLAVCLSRTGLGSTGVWIAWPIGWIAATALSVSFYSRSFAKRGDAAGAETGEGTGA